MRTRLILILTLANLFCCAAAEQRKSPPAKLEITEFHATHTGATLTFQGKVKNTGLAPAVTVQLVFTLLDANKKGLSTRRGPIDEESLASGEVSGFFFESTGNDDAVDVRIEATTLSTARRDHQRGTPPH